MVEGGFQKSPFAAKPELKRTGNKRNKKHELKPLSEAFTKELKAEAATASSGTGLALPGPPGFCRFEFGV